MLVDFVGACRQYAAELEVNEVTARSNSELQQYLEAITKTSRDGPRHAGDGDRAFRQSQVEAAIRFCRPVLGAEYGEFTAKAAEIALQMAASERQPARA